MLIGMEYHSAKESETSDSVANYISSLQKADKCDSPSDNGSFLQHCFEIFLSPANSDSHLFLPISGGSDSGMFCVVGNEFNPSHVLYHNIPGSSSTPSRLKAGDIILAINGYEISGYTCRDAVKLIDNMLQINCDPSVTKALLRLRVCPPSALSTGNSTLCSFLAFAFPQHSPEYALQERIRDNVYQRVVPCTTRLPRADEVDGVHYHFMSVPEFLALERAGRLLESGMYKGNHYGTPWPSADTTPLGAVVPKRPSLPTCSSELPTDDSCKIPPPLPPLVSFTGMLSQPSKSTLSSALGEHPQPPRPPLRNSSINTQLASSEKPITSCSNKAHTNVSGASQGSNSGTGEVNFDPPTSSNWKALSPCWEQSNHASHGGYLIDCDVADSSFTEPSAFVTGPIQSLVPNGSGPSVSSSADPGQPLPFGWEVVRDPKYGTFYIDHVHERTQYEPPTEEDFAAAAVIQAQRRAPCPAFSCNKIANNTIVQQQKQLQQQPTSLCMSPFVSRPSLENGVTTARVKESNSCPSRIPPTMFTSDPTQLRGPVLTVDLKKSSRGFGFTIIGGSDCSRAGFLQIRHIIPGGPASLDNRLSPGDLLIMVNSTNVLGYTHPRLVSLFQSIPVGAIVQLTVSQGYSLAMESLENGNSPTLKNCLPSHNPISPRLSNHPSLPTAFSNLSVASGSSTVSSTASPSSSSSSSSSSVLDPKMPHKPNSATSQVRSPTLPPNRIRASSRPEFLKVSIFKQSSGFGFTLADHPQGQRVKAILDPDRCGRLQVGDIVVEINDQRVKEIPHAEVVQILKQCPIGHETRLLVQRGGLHAIPLSLLSTAGGLSARTLIDNENNAISSLKVAPITSEVPSSIHLNVMSDEKAMYSEPHLFSSNSIHVRTASSGAIHLAPVPNDADRLRSRTPDPQSEKLYMHDTVGLRDPREHSLSHIALANPPRVSRPSDDSVLLSANASTASLHAPDPYLSNYGSLVRRSRMPISQPPDTMVAPKVECGPFLALPVENSTHLRPQSSGFPEDNAHSRLSLNGVQRCAPTRPCDTIVEVVVPRSRKGDGFGFFITNTHPNNLCNGKSGRHAFSSPKPPGEYIAHLVPGSKAERLGLLSVGDQIVAVNRTPVFGLRHDQVVRLIRESGSYIVLTIVPSSASSWIAKHQSQTASEARIVEFPVTLSRGSSGFGFSIRGDQEFNRMPLLVLRVADGGAAQMDGRLQVGDEIIEINGCSTMGMSHCKAIEIIQAGGNTMHLMVRRRTQSGTHAMSRVQPDSSVSNPAVPASGVT